MINDSFDLSKGIVNVVLSGEVTIDEMISWIDSLTPERIPLSTLKLFDDASRANYTFPQTEIARLDEVIHRLCSRYTRVIVAIVHQKPRETAYSDLIIGSITAPNYFQKIFYVREMALSWLLEN